ncbi:SRPBCC family protein [Streptomyces sp. NPDC051320]|uniref:type II toxin-antitoxin system RatA family toxin n=1 Tax=Streptomyces sp. NPDC051320 TaxID=3154644 RepID=UPI00343ECF3B
MRRVELNAEIDAVEPDTVYAELVRFELYPGLTRHVKSTQVHRTLPHDTGESSWELNFRSGLLCWTEQEKFLRSAGRIEFEQVEGDFDEMSGAWQLEPLAGGGCTVRFRADFDFGIASMESILDPIAEQVIKETIARAVVGMFDGARVVGESGRTATDLTATEPTATDLGVGSGSR